MWPMNLRTYIDSRRGAGADLARALSLPKPLIYQWAAEVRRVPADHCPGIERETAGAVRCEELRPDIDWAYLRGTVAVDAEKPAKTEIPKEAA